MRINTKVNILIAEDDFDDRVIIEDVISKLGFNVKINFVSDGEELISFLNNKEIYEDKKANPKPSLILMDLKMPKMNGFEVLQKIKTKSPFQNIPVIVFSTSN